MSTGLATASSSVTALSTGIANGTVGLVQQVGGAPGNGTITVGANTGGNVVDFMGTAGASQLTGVAAGTAPTDAVNVSQLQAVAAIANDAVLYDNASHASVTLGGVGGSVALGSGAQASGAGSSAVGANAVVAAPNSVALGAGSVASDANSVSIGSLGHERTISNVAPDVSPTDAVNMQQLDSVQQGVNAVARQAYSGIAGATALTMIPDVDPGKTLSVGIGSGNYKGYTAVAIGFSARVTANLKVKGGVGTSATGKPAVCPRRSRSITAADARPDARAPDRITDKGG